jgi:hypothetical protein
MKQGGIVVREWEDRDAEPVAQQAKDGQVLDQWMYSIVLVS